MMAEYLYRRFINLMRKNPDVIIVKLLKRFTPMQQQMIMDVNRKKRGVK